MASVSMLLVISAGAAPARADLTVGAGISGVFGVGQGNQVTLPNSWSLNGLLGYRLRLASLELTPEMELMYLNSIESLAYRHVDWAFRASAGGRVGLRLNNLVPSAYVHFGLGEVRFTADGSVRQNRTGPAVEVGAALDYRLADPISLGVQVGYSAVRIGDIAYHINHASIDWLRAGIHLNLFL